MLAVALLISGFVSGCATIVLSAAFAVASKDRLYDESFGLIAAAVVSMALALGLSIAAGRML